MGFNDWISRNLLSGICDMVSSFLIAFTSATNEKCQNGRSGKHAECLCISLPALTFLSAMVLFDIQLKTVHHGSKMT